MNAAQEKPIRLVVVAPVYDDAAAAGQLLQNLFGAFSETEAALHVVLVDDGSPVPLSTQLRTEPGWRVDVLRLRRNVGHQRAIALGTAFVHEHLPCDAMLVMDADGEDRPADAVRLMNRYQEEAGRKIIFAERTRRTESRLFQALYRAYQILHWVLTGIRVRVGNFSIVPAGQLPALVTLPTLWNHYAAAIYQARLPQALLPTVRGTRYDGQSKMNVVSLVMHGLQAISVFIDVVMVRLLLSICLVAAGCTTVLGAMVAARLFANGPAPSWAPLVAAGLFILLPCLVLGGLALALASLAGRKSLDFIPVRDYRFFIEAVHSLSPDTTSAAVSHQFVLLEEHSFPFTSTMAMPEPSAAR